MAKYDLDASHADPYARRTNRAALAGLLGTAAIVIGASWFQAHPYQGGATNSTWHATISYHGALYDAAGPTTTIADAQMTRVGTTRDGRGVFQPVGGGGGGGKPQLFVQMTPGLYLPIKVHDKGASLPDYPLGGMSDQQTGRRTQLPGQPPPGILP
jgi:hypothetical protein